MQGMTIASEEAEMKEYRLPGLLDFCSGRGLFAQLFSDPWEPSLEP